MSTATQTRPTPSGARGGSRGGPVSQAWRASTIDPIKVLRRYKWLIGGAGALGAILGVVAFFAFSKFYPLYEEQVHFEVKPGLRSSTEMAALDITNDDLVFRIGKTETLFLTRRDVLEKAVREPDIREKTRWHQQFIQDDGTFSIQDAVDDLEEDIRAGVIRGTNYFTLSWRTHEPSDVPIVLNAVADSYMNKRGDIDSRVYNENINIFRTQLADTNRDMEDLTREINETIVNRGITTLEDVRFHQEARAQEEATEQLQSMRTNLQLNLSTYNQVASRLEGVIEPSDEDIEEAKSHPNVLSQRRLISELKAELRHLEGKFSPEHPSVREVQGRLDATELEMQEQIDEMVRQTLRGRKKQLENQIEQLQKTVQQLDDEIVSRDAILRDLAAGQAEFEGMEKRREHLEKRREVELQLIKEAQLMKLRADANRIQLVKRAATPREMMFPRIEIMIPLFGLLGVALTTGLIFLRELTDQRVKSGSDLTIIPGAVVLGAIPELAEDPTKSTTAEMVVRQHPHSVLAESYRQAMSSINRRIEHTGYQSIMLVGGLPGAGTTTIATNLAAAATAMGKSTVLVDANMRRPGVTNAVGFTGEHAGLGDVLCDAVTLDEVIITSDDGIAVVPAGTKANRRFERLSDPRFETMIGDLRSRYDLVIVDAPPAVVAGDALVLANKVDTTVIVVRAAQEQRGLVARMISQFSDAQSELLGVLLNRPRGTAGGYFKKNYATMAAYMGKD